MKFFRRNGSRQNHMTKIFVAVLKEDETFEIIKKEILHFSNCLILIPDDEFELDQLNDVSAIIVPLTKAILCKKNKITSEIVPYAISNHIPLLPIAMEEDGLENYASIFHDLHFLNHYKNDPTEIPYPEKLKQYLDHLTIEDEMIEKIENTFSSKCFLSYRKKDRRFARRIIDSIHNEKKFYDVAIWFDEYLHPGEDFSEEIAKALKDTSLFLLCVTPNLLEKNNYVAREEYPCALRLKKFILPIEMDKTDYNELKSDYPSIPAPVSEESIAESLKKHISASTDFSGQHRYLTALAYLNGISMEINLRNAIFLLKECTEENYLPAIDKLTELYSIGRGVSLDYDQAIFYCKKAIHHSEDTDTKSCKSLFKRYQTLCHLYKDSGKDEELLSIVPDIFSFAERNSVILEDDKSYEAYFDISLLYLDCQAKYDPRNEKSYDRIRKLYNELKAKEETALHLWMMARLCHIAFHFKTYDYGFEDMKIFADYELTVASQLKDLDDIYYSQAYQNAYSDMWYLHKKDYLFSGFYEFARDEKTDTEKRFRDNPSKTNEKVYGENLSILAQCTFEKGEEQKSFPLYEDALSHLVKYQDTIEEIDSIVNLYLTIARHYMMILDFSSARINYEKAMEFIKKHIEFSINNDEKLLLCRVSYEYSLLSLENGWIEKAEEDLDSALGTCCELLAGGDTKSMNLLLQMLSLLCIIAIRFKSADVINKYIDMMYPLDDSMLESNESKEADKHGDNALALVHMSQLYGLMEAVKGNLGSSERYFLKSLEAAGGFMMMSHSDSACECYYEVCRNFVLVADKNHEYECSKTLLDGIGPFLEFLQNETGGSIFKIILCAKLHLLKVQSCYDQKKIMNASADLEKALSYLSQLPAEIEENDGCHALCLQAKAYQIALERRKGNYTITTELIQELSGLFNKKKDDYISAEIYGLLILEAQNQMTDALNKSDENGFFFTGNFELKVKCDAKIITQEDFATLPEALKKFQESCEAYKNDLQSAIDRLVDAINLLSSLWKKSKSLYITYLMAIFFWNLYLMTGDQNPKNGALHYYGFLKELAPDSVLLQNQIDALTSE